MSPEQAQGKAVDQRSDIFSFGCILYEAVTSHKPFEGDSLIDVLHKIVYAQPPAVTDFLPRSPLQLQRIIRKCLVKDPERRYQSIKDVAIDLHEPLDEGEADLSSLGVKRVSPISSTSWERQEFGTELPELLSDSDPRVLETTRLSKSTVALVLFGLLGAFIVWPAYNRSEVGALLKLDYSREAALTKAREVVKSFGHDITGLEASAGFRSSRLDLKQLAAAKGLDAVRQAVSEGEAAAWRILFSRKHKILVEMDTELPKPGEFSVEIRNNGQLASFYTSPLDSGDLSREAPW